MLSKLNTTDPLTRRFRQACAELDRSLRAGTVFRTEDWVQDKGPFSHDDDLAVEFIFTEYVTRESLGQTPQPDEYYTRFPRYADRLKRLFGVDELLKEDLVDTDAETLAPPNTNGDTPVAQRDRPSNIPAKISRYEPREIIGTGGAGVVYRAWDPSLRRDVAIKVLKSGDAAGAGERERFRREAEAVARLNHRNVVHLYEVGDHEGRPFIVMEYLPGGTLRTRFGGKTMAPLDAARIVKTLARAAAHAHARGIVHRDIKPGNVLLEESRSDDRSSTFVKDPDDVPNLPTMVLNPKLTDFGLAALLGPNDQPSISGNLIGTASYMAPEQAEGKRGWVTPAVDVYALGAVLYELLVGRAPFLADNPLDTLRMVVTEDPVPPRQILATVPADLETICLLCLRKDPSKRYANAAALADDLHRYLDNRPIAARPAGPMERAFKWARRHPALTVAGTITTAALLTVAIGSAVFAAKLKTERDEKEDQRSQAEAGRTDAEKKRIEAVILKEKAEDLVRKTTELRYATQLMRVGLTADINPTVAGVLLRDEDFCPPQLREFTWHWLDGRTKPLVAEKPGMLAPAVAMAVNTNGTLAITVDTKGNIRGWAPATGETRFILNDLGTIRAIASNTEGTTFITGDTAGLAKLWTVPEKGDPTVTVVLPKQDKAIRAVAFLPDNTVAVGAGNKVQLYSTAGMTITSLEMDANETVRSLAVTADGSMLAAGTDKGTISIYSLPDRKRTRTFTGHNGPVVGVAFGPGGRVLVSGSTGFGSANFIKVWDVVGNRLSADLPARNSCWAVAVSADGSTVASSGADGLITLWDPVFGKAKAVYGRNQAGGVPGAAMMVNNNPARNENITAGDIPNTVAGVAFVGNTQRLVSASYDRLLRIWESDATRGRVTVPMSELPASIFAALPGNDGVVVASKQEPVRIWHPRKGIVTLPFSSENSTALAISADSKQVLMCIPLAKDNRGIVTASQLKLVDVVTGKALWTVDSHQAFTNQLEFSTDGKYVVSSASDKTLALRDATTGKLIRSVELEAIPVAYVVRKSDIIIAAEKAVWVWNAFAENHKPEVKHNATDRIGNLVLNKDGDTLAVTAAVMKNTPHTITLLDTKSFAVKSHLTASTGTIRGIDFTPDGRTLAVSWNDRKIRLYHIPTGQELGTVEDNTAFTGRILFLHNGRCMIAHAGNPNGPAFSLWDTGTDEVKK